MKSIKFQSIVKTRIYVAPIPKGRVLPVPHVFTNTEKVLAGSNVMTLALASIDGRGPRDVAVELEHDHPFLFPVNPKYPGVNDIIRLNLGAGTRFVHIGASGKTVTVSGVNRDVHEGALSLNSYIFRQLLGMEEIEIEKNNEGINLLVKGIYIPGDMAQKLIWSSVPLYVRFDSPGMALEGVSTVTGVNDFSTSDVGVYRYNFTISKVTDSL